MSTDPFCQKKVDVGGRSFLIMVVRFENGSFVSVSEGSRRLGPMTVSMGTGPTPVTTPVIPSRSDALFLRLVAERISSASRGISIVSCGIGGELGADSAKTLMAEIVGMMQDA